MTRRFSKHLVAILVVALALPALTLAGGGTLAAETLVHPLSESTKSGPTFTDLAFDSVTVELQTSIAVVCAAAYGPTTAYGHLATTLDMAAGGQTDHHPVLIGLKPDTTYQVRLQGVGPDGTLYVGENLSVHTPAAPVAQVAATAGKNVALLSAGATIQAVSSNYGGGDNRSAYGANHAIDGDPATQWSSNGDGDNAWISVDLGRTYAINAIGLSTRTMVTSAQIESFSILTDAGEKLGPFTLPDAKLVYYFPVKTTARTLRFSVIKSSGGNTGVGEIEVYSTAQ